MPTFLLLTRVDSDAAGSPGDLEHLEQQAMQHIRSECPEVHWQRSYAALGPYDYVDIFDAPDIDTATKVSMIIRTYGHAHSEVWPLTDWNRFKEMIHEAA